MSKHAKGLTDRRRLRSALIVLLVAGTAALGAAVAAPTAHSKAQKTYLIRFSAAQGEGYPSVVAAHYFANQVAKLSHGQLKVQIYLSGQLAGAPGTAAGLQNGTIQMGYLSPSWISSIVPQAAAYSLPFAFKDKAAAYRAMDGKAASQIDADLIKNGGIKILGWWDANFGQFLNNRRPINTVSDLKGLRMRIIAGPVTLATYNAWKTVPVAMDFTELPTALSQGTVDGFDQPLPSIVSNKFDEITKYLSISNDTYYVELFMVNAKFFNSLPKNLQAIITKVAPKATVVQRKAASASNATALAAAKKAGMVVNTVTPANAVAFRKAIYPVYASTANQLGVKFVNQMLRDAAGKSKK